MLIFFYVIACVPSLKNLLSNIPFCTVCQTLLSIIWPPNGSRSSVFIRAFVQQVAVLLYQFTSTQKENVGLIRQLLSLSDVLVNFR